MSKRPVLLTRLVVGAGCFALPAALHAQIIRTLPETTVTASPGGSAGEGDLDQFRGAGEAKYPIF